MSTDNPEKLLSQWRVAQLTVERAIGQILQHIVALYTGLHEAGQKRQQLRNDLDHLKGQVEALVAHTKLPADSKPKRRGRPRKQHKPG